jgi:hypothetical protein
VHGTVLVREEPWSNQFSLQIVLCRQTVCMCCLTTAVPRLKHVKLGLKAAGASWRSTADDGCSAVFLRCMPARKLQLLLHLIRYSVCCFLCRLCMLLSVHAMLGLRLYDNRESDRLIKHHQQINIASETPC